MFVIYAFSFAHEKYGVWPKLNPSNSKPKKYILLALSREMYKWGSENW